METSKSVATALTIAGSDSGGGAGIQADLSTFAFHRVHGTSALTAITAQNTQGVTRVDVLPAGVVAAQIDAVASDIGVGAVKTGMLVNRTIIDHGGAAACAALCLAPARGGPGHGVPRAARGSSTTRPWARCSELLLPLATVVTPNRHEAEPARGHRQLETLEDMRRGRAPHPRVSARRRCWSRAAACTGALRGTDVWFDGSAWRRCTCAALDTPQHARHRLHAVRGHRRAAWRWGDAPLEATRRAKDVRHRRAASTRCRWARARAPSATSSRWRGSRARSRATTSRPSSARPARRARGSRACASARRCRASRPRKAR